MALFASPYSLPIPSRSAIDAVRRAHKPVGGGMKVGIPEKDFDPTPVGPDFQLPGFTDPITGERRFLGTQFGPAGISEEEQRARGITARKLNLLRQILGGQEQSGIARLRQQLAGRGLLDSGSLGAGITDITKDISERLAEGTQAAAIGESELLTRLIEAERERGFRARESAEERAFRERLARAEREAQRPRRRSAFESFLTPVATGLGTAVGGPIGGAIGGGIAGIFGGK